MHIKTTYCNNNICAIFKFLKGKLIQRHAGHQFHERQILSNEQVQAQGKEDHYNTKNIHVHVHLPFAIKNSDRGKVSYRYFLFD